MSARVNLLKDTEYRRQGMVSGTFLMRVSLAAIVCFSLLFGALGAFRYREARRQLAAARKIWAIREPLYRKILAMKQDVATYRKLNQELSGWAGSRVTWHPPLKVLQQIVHPSMQLRRLNIRGETEIRVPRGTTSATAKAQPLSNPIRQFFLTIEGRASGYLAEDVVLQFDASIRRAPSFREILETVRLQRLQSETAPPGKQADRSFAFEASTMKREVSLQ